MSELKPQGRYLTISVDDGHPADQRSADLLSKYGLKATFYIPKTNPERKVMDEPSIKRIAQSFEIGGHTYSHKALCNSSAEEIEREVKGGKRWMEQLLGKTIIAFCYPRGKFNSAAIKAVRDSGFKGARTCRFNLNHFPSNPYLWGISAQAHLHSMSVQVRHAVVGRNLQGLLNFFYIHKGCTDWVIQFKNAVEFVRNNAGVAHLYFHSWEIDQLSEWGKLEDLFQYLSGIKDLERVTNGELFSMWHKRKIAV
jgi:peptidoglycan-N-acetylglucosamine deacetylase